MFRNYLKTAIRSLVKNRGYALLNILGLAIGMAACILIFVVLRFETSFDNFHPKRDKIFRVTTEFHDQDGVSYSSGISFPVAPALRLDFPQIKEITSTLEMGNVQITADNNSGAPKKFNESGIYFLEPSFFDLFHFEWIAGNPRSSLSQPNEAVLTQRMAEKYFGNWKTAIGKTISQDNKYTYKITGILKNTPPNTDFPFDVVASYATLPATSLKRNLDDWVSTFSQSYCFLVLPSNIQPVQFNQQLRAFAKRHKPAEYATDSYALQPFTEMHYDEKLGTYGSHTFSKSLIRALVLIGLFLLIIACVNFINLATAQAVNRSKEVGVRKVLGSNKKQLTIQFLCETSLITFVSVLLGTLLALTALPFLNKLLEVQMNFSFLKDPDLLLFLLGIFVLTSILSGFYPAIILSGFNPITALKTKISAKMVGGISIRRGLVVLQFTIAHILIIGTIIVVSQMNYFRNASLGFERAAVINVPVPGDSISHTRIDYLRNRLQQNPDIKNVSFSYSSPSADGNWNSDFKFNHAVKSTDFSANLKWADADYFKTYNLKFVAGRPYYPSDTVREFVVNETLLHKLGIVHPEDAIGKQLDFWDGKVVAPIVGVIRDFNSYSLRSPMAPVVLGAWKHMYQTINIKINPSSKQSVLSYVEKAWNQSFPDYVYQYHFLDDTIANFYKQEDQLSQLYKIFAGLAILISCLGLYGLVSFMAVQRTKELGIRKVLGATATHIVYLLSREFTLLILVAFVIAGPVAYYAMQKWLQNYTYRIHMNAWIFILAIVGSMVIAWLTVGHRAIKTALASPVKNLRTE
ncbi:MAG: ABC transporter permease [Flavisolibacter sp.]